MAGLFPDAWVLAVARLVTFLIKRAARPAGRSVSEVGAGAEMPAFCATGGCWGAGMSAFDATGA